MNNPVRKSVLSTHDLLDFTGRPNIPSERPDTLTPDQRAKGGKRARKTISGVKEYSCGSRKGKKPCWRVIIKKSGRNARDLHSGFIYNCPTREEAAYIASMARRLLKPSFARECRRGNERMEPAGPGDALFFLNNIWSLWKYCQTVTKGGDLIIGALSGEGSCRRPVFITDFNADNYEKVIQAPLFNRRTVDRRRNYEPVQPHVYLDEDGKVRVEWIGLSELVLGEKVDLPPEKLAWIDFRKAALLGEDVPPPIPGLNQLPLSQIFMITPQRFNAVVPRGPQYVKFHPYGVIHHGNR